MIRRLQRAAELIAAFFFAIMFGAFLVQIVSRYGFNAPVSWSLEVCSLSYIWIVYWSAALLVGERQHIAFDLLYKAAPAPLRRGLALFITLSIGIVFAVGFSGSLDYITFLRRKTLMLHVPLSLAYSCFLLFLIAAVVGAVVRVRRLLGRDWRHHL